MMSADFKLIRSEFLQLILINDAEIVDFFIDFYKSNVAKGYLLFKCKKIW